VVGIFRNYNPFGIIFLFFYGLVLRFASFVDPHIPVAQQTDGFLYHGLLNILSGIGQATTVVYPILAYLLVFIQAMTLNNLINNHRLLPKASFLPAMAYLLVTSLFPEWWQFSAALFVNSLLVWVWARMSGLYNNNRAKWVLFNIGMVLGFCSFFYFPSIAFVVLMIFALVIMRPLNFSEWLVGLLGITTPYYFLFAYLYLSSQWDPARFLPSLSLSFPNFQQNIWAWGGMVLLVVPFLISGYYIQGNILRMLIQVRKSWSLLLLYLLTALLVPFINSSSTFEYWILCAPPFAAFHAIAFFQSNKKNFPLILHWIMVAFILALNVAVLRA
jgi:hypothetical protein